MLLPRETDPVYGREAIEKYFADLFTQYMPATVSSGPISIPLIFDRYRWQWIVEQWELECSF